jgi:hypothetical protein
LVEISIFTSHQHHKLMDRYSGVALGTSTILKMDHNVIGHW